MKFLHTMIRVKDIEKSLDFYQKIIGLKLSKTKELKDATLYFLSDKEGYTEIELTYNHTLPEDGYELGNNLGHFAFATDNMDNFTQKLKANGLNYYRVPFLLSGIGPKIAFIKDPDGIQIELIEKAD
ncbi:MAG: VOC family protein [Candidatus Gastranaerophilales bacterium]|nr:VOC family protein [Candidatus Gastranaerophilales bacterium]